MKNRWLIVMLVASLALNAGMLGAFGYHRYLAWRHERVFFRNLRSGAGTRLKAVLEETRPQMDSLRQVYRDARRQLGELGFQDRPDSLEVERLLGVIAQTHREMNRIVFATTRKVESMYPADKREGVRRRLREMWEDHHWRGPRRRFPPRVHGMPPPGPPPEEGP